MTSYGGARALVTGGTRGIGRAVAVRLKELGADVTVTGRAPKVPELAAGISYLQADLSSPESTANLADAVRAMSGLMVLVNNAGINRIHRIEDFPADEFDEITQVNYTSAYRLTQAAAQVMLAEKTAGRIVNIASIWATHTRVGRTAYCAAKAGLLGMTRSISADLAAHGILVNAVSPGFVRTDLTAQTLGPDGIAEVSAQIPSGRFAEPEEIAEVVSFLASPDNTYLTGQNIIVDGGFTNV